AEEPAIEEPAIEDTAASIGTADTALWADLRDVVEAEVAPQVTELPDTDLSLVERQSEIEVPRRPSAETPAEIESVLDAAFGELGKAPKRISAEQIQRPAIDRAPIESEPEVPIIVAPSAPIKVEKKAPEVKAPEPPKVTKPVEAKASETKAP